MKRTILTFLAISAIFNIAHAQNKHNITQMKKVIFIGIICILPLVGFGQKTITKLNDSSTQMNIETDDVIYGLLYNGYVVRSSNNVCPTGWHVPTNSEFIILMNYIKGNTNFQCNNIVNNIAKAMASASYWNSSTVSCAIGNIPTNNNGSGFSVLPSGTWEVSDGIEYVGQSSGIWTSTSYSSVQNYYLYFMHSSATVSNNYGGLSGGVYSIRCIKD